MDVLAAVRTVHESAAVCDHIEDRDDVEAVVGVGVAPADDPDASRDADEALNVLAVRLPGVAVSTARRTGAAAAVVAAAADDHGVDEVVVAEGSTVVSGLAAATGRQVTVVPDPASGGGRP